MHLALFTGDSGIAYGKKNIFYEMLKEFSTYFDRVSVICPSNEIGEEIIIHKNVHLYPSNYSKFLHFDFFRHYFYLQKKALQIHKEYPIDLISAQIIPPFFSNIRAAIKLNKILKIPFLGELMHVPCYPVYSNFVEWVEKFCLKRFLNNNKNEINYLRIINKTDTLNFLNAINFPSRKNKYIPAFYIDFETFKPALPHNTTKNTIEKNINSNKQFVFAGRLEQNKGLELLIDAFEIAIKEDNQIKLKIIGEGSLKEKTFQLIKEKNLEKNIEMVGWLPTQKDVAQIYSQSTALVMPSFNEGGPRVTLEAMACKCLCLTTRVGIMNQIIKDKENAIFIDWNAEDIAQKVLFVTKNPEQSAQIALQGYKTVQQFEFHKSIKECAKKFKEVTTDSQ